MRRDDLEAMRADLAGPESLAAADTMPAADTLTAEPPAPLGPPPEEIVQISEAATAMLAGIICRRANVTPLEEEEIANLGGAVAQLIHAYGVNLDLSPKAAAWLGFGLTALSTISRREKIGPAANDNQGEPQRPPVPVAQSDGTFPLDASPGSPYKSGV